MQLVAFSHWLCAWNLYSNFDYLNPCTESTSPSNKEFAPSWAGHWRRAWLSGRGWWGSGGRPQSRSRPPGCRRDTRRSRQMLGLDLVLKTCRIIGQNTNQSCIFCICPSFLNRLQWNLWLTGPNSQLFCSQANFLASILSLLNSASRFSATFLGTQH